MGNNLYTLNSTNFKCATWWNFPCAQSKSRLWTYRALQKVLPSSSHNSVFSHYVSNHELVFSALELHINETQYVLLFFDSFSQCSVYGIIHLLCAIIIHFLYYHVVSYSMDIPQFIHSITDKHGLFFLLLAIYNKAVLSMIADVYFL